MDTELLDTFVHISKTHRRGYVLNTSCSQCQNKTT